MRREAFERLYEEHAEPLLAFLIYRTADRELAADIHSDTFERALTARARFDPRRASAKTWLYTIALNRLRDHYRRRAAEGRALERVAAGGGDAPTHVEALEDRDALMRGLETLSDDEREAVALRYGGDLSIREIAQIAGTRQPAIKGRLHRGLEKLRAELD